MANRPAKNSEPAAEASSAEPPRGLRWVLAGVVGLCVATPLVPAEAAMDQGVHVMLTAMWLVLLGGWLLVHFSRERWTIRWDWLVASVLAFCFWQVLSGVMMAERGSYRFSLNVIWVWIDAAAMVFLSRQVVRGTKVVRATLIVMAAAALAVAIVGMYQYLVTSPSLRERYHRDPEQTLREAGYFVSADSPVREHFRNRVESKEPLATFVLTNSLAGFLLPWIVILGCSAWAAARTVGPSKRGGTRRGNRWAATGMGLGAAVLLGVLLLTRSRSAIVGLVCGLAVLLWRARGRESLLSRRTTWALVGAAAVLGGIVFYAKGYDPRDLSLAPKSLLVRLEYWRGAAAVAVAHPVWGCGGGNFQEYYNQVKPPQASESPRDPHNFLLETWANSGAPGLVLLLLVGWCAVREWRRRTIDGEPGDAASSSRTAVHHPEANPPKTAADCDQPIWPVYWGGAGGIVFGWVLAYLVRFPGEMVHLGGLRAPLLLLLGLPAAAAVVWAADGWIRGGSMHPRTVLAAGGALLVNLLSAGGLAMPGVAVGLWLVLICWWELMGGRTWTTKHDAISCGAGLVGVVVLYFLFHQSEYSPILTGQLALDDGEAVLARARELVDRKQVEFARSSLEEAIQSLGKAAAADPYSHQPWLSLAEAHRLLWMLSPRSTEDQEFERAAGQAMKLNALSAETARRVGDLYLAAYRQRGLQWHLDTAIETYRRAVRLQQGSAPLHAQLAWTLHLDGQREAAAAEAAEALRCHALVSDPVLGLSAERAGAGEAVSGGSPPTVRRGVELFDPGPGSISETKQLSGPISGQTSEQTMRGLRSEGNGE